jgi:hypothetical protein
MFGAGSIISAPPLYLRMGQLAAGLLSVGATADLYGQDTRAHILTCRRVAAGARGLVVVGDIELWQATGPEFDGAFSWAPMGAASAPTWGAPGDKLTGGLICPVGAVALGGFRGISGLRRNVTAEWVVDSVPAVPAQHDALLAGTTRFGASPRLLYAGGVGYGTGGKIRGAVCLGDNPDALTIDVSADAEGTFTGQARALTHYSMHRRSSTANLAGYCGAWTGLDVNADGGDSVRVGPNATPVEADELDFEVTLARRGAWSARCISLIADFGV